ncbi:hypothetical protein EVA_08036 [gut metagenome]|uniref:Uncharacterized protein n=1 Tax=gut metagenome TaxID=749906 RepID=J9GAI9_9ZZZZ
MPQVSAEVQETDPLPTLPAYIENPTMEMPTVEVDGNFI